MAEVARGAGRVGLAGAESTLQLLVAGAALAAFEATLRHRSLGSQGDTLETMGEAGDVLGSG